MKFKQAMEAHPMQGIILEGGRSMLKLGAALAIVIPVILSASAQAAPSLTARQAATVTSIESKARAMQRPRSAAQIHAQTAAIQPMVDRVIAQAKATRDGAAVQALINRTNLPGSAAVHAAILKDTPQYDVSATPTTISVPTRMTAAGADPCYGSGGSVWTRHYWSGALYTVAWVSVYSNGWCGNGRSITYFGGFGHRSYTGPGYCLRNNNYDDGSWLVFWSWVHGGHWAEPGLDVPLVGCLPLPFVTSAGATLREAANGYWDRLYR